MGLPTDFFRFFQKYYSNDNDIKVFIIHIKLLNTCRFRHPDRPDVVTLCGVRTRKC